MFGACLSMLEKWSIIYIGTKTEKGLNDLILGKMYVRH